MLDHWRQRADPHVFYSLPVEHGIEFLKLADALAPKQENPGSTVNVGQQALQGVPFDDGIDGSSLVNPPRVPTVAAELRPHAASNNVSWPNRVALQDSRCRIFNKDKDAA